MLNQSNLLDSSKDLVIMLSFCHLDLVPMSIEDIWDFVRYILRERERERDWLIGTCLPIKVTCNIDNLVAMKIPIPVVVNLEQQLGVAHYRHWLKSLILCFLHISARFWCKTLVDTKMLVQHPIKLAKQVFRFKKLWKAGKNCPSAGLVGIIAYPVMCWGYSK